MGTGYLGAQGRVGQGSWEELHGGELGLHCEEGVGVTGELGPRRREFQMGNSRRGCQDGLSCLGDRCMEMRRLDLVPRITGSPGRVLNRGHMEMIPLVPQKGRGVAGWEAGPRGRQCEFETDRTGVRA